MKLTTRTAGWGINIKTDEVSTDIFKNGNESNEFIQNLLDVVEEVCNIRNESIFTYLENHYSITIKEK